MQDLEISVIDKFQRPHIAVIQVIAQIPLPQNHNHLLKIENSE